MSFEVTVFSLLVSLLDDERESEKGCESHITLSGKNEERSVPDTLIEQLCRLGCRLRIDTVNKTFHKMQQHNGSYRKTSESIGRVCAFRLGGLVHTIISRSTKIRKRKVISRNKLLCRGM